MTTNWQDDPLWYKDAIIYQVHVKAFYDASGDGTGDFRGLAERLDYIEDLGVNTIWLLPFYPSPMRDDGYDISDYRNVHPAFGTLTDFKRFVREAHRRGLRVITELVVNHTSDQHPWFQAARKAPLGSPRRDFYVWSKTKLKFPETRIIFTDTETSNWAWDDEAQAYYWHRFFSHQPDLNHNNPKVVDAIIKVMRFWLDMGVDGLRLDAIPYLCVREGTDNENLPETHAVLKRMREVVDANYQNRMFLAEANQWPEDVLEYFGDSDECHMCYHFPLMPRIYMAVAQEDRHPIVEIMRQTPPIPDDCQWAIFLRNHDELTLEMVTDRERDYMYQIYATDRRMRLNVGIRRRLAPLMDNDPERIKLMNALLLSMPGSPIIYYGDEIAMGDNIYLGDRNGVRTPMQWSPDRNAGFSRADPQALYLPPIMDPVYGYQAVNVEAQSRAPSSLLNWTRRILAVRKAYRAFGRGTLEFLHPGNRKILAYVRSHDDDTILCVVNLSRSAQPVELDLARWRGRVPVEMMGRIPFPPIGDLPYLLTLSSYGVYWFRLASEVEEPSWHKEQLPAIELTVLVLFEGWRSFAFAQPDTRREKRALELRSQLEVEVLPQWLPAQRWYAAKGTRLDSVSITRAIEWECAGRRWLITWLHTHSGGARDHYFLPLALFWEKHYDEYRAHLVNALAKVRQHARVGLLVDAYADERFCRALVQATRAGVEIPVTGGRLQFFRTSAFDRLWPEDDEGATVRRPPHESSNSAVVIGERLFLKGYRRLCEGISIEVEVGRFLTEESPLENIIPVAGWIVFQPDHGAVVTLAVLQAYVENQGDGWAYTQGYLQRHLQDCLHGASTGAGLAAAEIHATDLMMMHTLGRRTGELHAALAKDTGNPAFRPEPVTPEELAGWYARVRQDATDTLRRLEQADVLPEAARAQAAALLAARERLLAYLDGLRVEPLGLLKTRYHGDLHLGQVLVAENDFIIIDFEGEPARPRSERAARHSPLRDVAGMLRSFSYAAHVALQHVTSESPGDLLQLAPYARQWERMAAEAYLLGYVEAAGEQPFYPAQADGARRLLDLFVLEKALYEVRYELDHRPDWVGVPLAGILGLLENA
ncbi:MAG: maltose alpha-D-glucosyltransferase [Thiohalomonadaceae bacterium]